MYSQQTGWLGVNCACASCLLKVYPVDSVVCFVNTYLLDSDLSGWIASSTLRTSGASCFHCEETTGKRAFSILNAQSLYLIFIVSYKQRFCEA